MSVWQEELKVDPVPNLLSTGNEAIKYFTLHDLLDKRVEPIDRLWELPEATKILKNRKIMVHGNILKVQIRWNMLITINIKLI